MASAKRHAKHMAEVGRALAGRISEHHSTQLAASISYYALLALFPAAIALTALASLFLGDESARQEVVDFLVRELPVNDDDGRGDLEELIDGVTENAAAIGVAGLIGLLWSASALMTALRNSVAIAFEVDERRSFVKGKAFDIAFIVGVGLLIAVSVGGTLLINLAGEAKDDLGVLGDAIGGVLGFLTGLLPVAITALIFGMLLTVVPARKVRIGEVWPAVVFGTVAFELAKGGFSIYLDNFSNYAAVYGSLGAIVAFMFFVYIGALVVLASAELAAMRLDDAEPAPFEGPSG